MIYFDNEALEQPSREVIDTVVDILTNHWFNPNSIYEEGLETKKQLFNAKEIIAKELNCSVDELIFCSSGSEAITTALMGVMKAYNKDYFITSTIGHSAVIDNPYAKTEIDVNEDGRFKIQDVYKVKKESIVALPMSDTEIGVTQNIKECSNIIHKKNGIIFSDLTGSFGKQKIDLKELGLDLAVCSSQKIAGMLGCAVLYIRDGIKIEPLIYGHNPLHNGTPNVAAICAMGKAVELLNWDAIGELKEKRDYFIDKLLSNDNITLNGSKDFRLPNNINITIDNINLDNQQLVAMMNAFGYCISAGSACNSGSKEPSKTLLAIGLTEGQANNTIRISLSNNNTYEEIDAFCNDLFGIMENFKKEPLSGQHFGTEK